VDLQQAIEAEATAAIGAAPHKRTTTRTAQLNDPQAKEVPTASIGA
jgi:hypothetical protein